MDNKIDEELERRIEMKINTFLSLVEPDHIYRYIAYNCIYDCFYY